MDKKPTKSNIFNGASKPVSPAPVSTPVPNPQSAPVSTAKPVAPASKPVATPPSSEPASPNLANTVATPTTPIQPNTANPEIIDQGKKKSKKAKIISICCAIALLIGVGVFGVVLAISNQPQNIVASAFDKLINSKYVSIDGYINTMVKELNASVNIELKDKRADSNGSTSATIKIDLPDINQSATLSFERVSINYGTIYLKAGGIKDIISSYSGTTQDPYAEGGYNDFANIVSEIAGLIENRWIKISYEELNNEMGQSVADSYNCIVDKINNKSSYGNEFTSLYTKYPFLDMQQAEDSFYDISFNTSNLAGYINSIPNTKLFSDLGNCQGVTTTANEISENDIKTINDYLPKISAKFTGMFSHELSELKITEDNDYYTLNSDLKFDYANNGDISEPTGDTISIKDLIEEIMLKFSQYYTYGFYDYDDEFYYDDDEYYYDDDEYYYYDDDYDYYDDDYYDDEDYYYDDDDYIEEYEI